MIKCAIEVTQDALNELHTKLSWVMHMKTHLLYNIRDIEPHDGEVLQSFSKTSVVRRIRYRWPTGRELRTRINGVKCDISFSIHFHAKSLGIVFLRSGMAFLSFNLYNGVMVVFFKR